MTDKTENVFFVQVTRKVSGQMAAVLTARRAEKRGWEAVVLNDYGDQVWPEVCYCNASGSSMCDMHSDDEEGE